MASCEQHSSDGRNSTVARPDRITESIISPHKAGARDGEDDSHDVDVAAYKRSVAIANRLPQELGSVGILSELRCDLLWERARTYQNEQQRHRASPQLRSPSEENAGSHSDNLEDAYRNLQPSPRFETATERYRRVLIAQRYHTALQSKGNRSWSVAEDFARKYLPDKSKKGLSKRKLQNKWRGIIHQYQFWGQLAVSCGGAGVLLLLPSDFHNEQ